jgi:hypothetical protein
MSSAQPLRCNSSNSIPSGQLAEAKVGLKKPKIHARRGHLPLGGAHCKVRVSAWQMQLCWLQVQRILNNRCPNNAAVLALMSAQTRRATSTCAGCSLVGSACQRPCYNTCMQQKADTKMAKNKLSTTRASLCSSLCCSLLGKIWQRSTHTAKAVDCNLASYRSCRHHWMPLGATSLLLGGLHTGCESPITTKKQA